MEVKGRPLRDTFCNSVVLTRLVPSFANNCTLSNTLVKLKNRMVRCTLLVLSF